MKSSARFNAHAVRDELLKRGGPAEDGFVRYAYRPFDTRWLYWDADTKLLDEKRASYKLNVFEGNLWLVSQQKPRRDWGSLQVMSHIGCLDLMDRGATCLPAWLRDDGLGVDDDGGQCPSNLSFAARHYLDRLGLGVADLFHYVIATLHDPEYRTANAGALRMEWPRVPLPGWPDGDTAGATDVLTESAARGRKLAALLDSHTPVAGVTTGSLRPELAAISVPMTTDGGNMAGVDFVVSTGWGHFGSGGVVTPGQGRIVERDYTDDERAALADAIPDFEQVWGDTTFDVYLNDRAYWRNVPVGVWNYQLGGYQVLKKWLSYRERRVLGRPLLPEEVQYFTDTSRRIVAIQQLVERI